MGELWHRRVRRFDREQRERLKTPSPRHSRRWLWMLMLAVALYVLFRFVLHIG